MTVACSAALQVSFLEWLSGSDMPSAPSSIKFGLLSAVPGDDGTNLNELNGNGYARQTVTFGSVTTDHTARISSMKNTAPVIFGPATADWVPATYGAFFSGDDNSLLAYGPLASSRTAPSGDSISFGVNALQIRKQ